MLNVIVRVDASTVIGSGHLMRCLTLAKRLRRMGHSVTFVMRAHQGSMQTVVEQQDFSYRMLARPSSYHGKEYESWLGVSQKEDAVDTIAVMGKQVNLLIVDHYALDHEWEELLRPHVNSILVIDDLANRPHLCDFLLDVNLDAEKEDKYTVLVPRGCRTFLGINYLLLRQEFYDVTLGQRHDTGTEHDCMRVFVCFGGSDPTNETMRTIRALSHYQQSKLDVYVVIGASNRHRRELEDFCRSLHWHVYCQIDYVALLMAKSDCAIGAGGTMTWERCFVGLPSLVVAVAENQREDAVLYDQRGIISYAGFWRDLDDETLNEKIHSFLDDKELQARIRENGSEIFTETHTEEMLEEVTMRAEAWKI